MRSRNGEIGKWLMGRGWEDNEEVLLQGERAGQSYLPAFVDQLDKG